MFSNFSVLVVKGLARYPVYIDEHWGDDWMGDAGVFHLVRCLPTGQREKMLGLHSWKCVCYSEQFTMAWTPCCSPGSTSASRASCIQSFTHSNAPRHWPSQHLMPMTSRKGPTLFMFICRSLITEILFVIHKIVPDYSKLQCCSRNSLWSRVQGWFQLWCSHVSKRWYPYQASHLIVWIHPTLVNTFNERVPKMCQALCC